jgi:hypothetical protein
MTVLDITFCSHLLSGHKTFCCCEVVVYDGLIVQRGPCNSNPTCYHATGIFCVVTTEQLEITAAL